MIDLQALFGEVCGVIKSVYPATLIPGNPGRTQVFLGMDSARLNFNEWAMRPGIVADPPWWVVSVSEATETDAGLNSWRVKKIPIAIQVITTTALTPSQWSVHQMIEKVAEQIDDPTATFTTFMPIETATIISGDTNPFNEEAQISNQHELIAAAALWTPGWLAGEI